MDSTITVKRGQGLKIETLIAELQSLKNRAIANKCDDKVIFGTANNEISFSLECNYAECWPEKLTLKFE